MKIAYYLILIVLLENILTYSKQCARKSRGLKKKINRISVRKILFELSGQCGPTYETVKTYLTVIEELKRKNESNIVKHLILRRFENDSVKFVKSVQEDRLSGDSGNDSTWEHCFETSLS
ncbi:hypothetical protein WA026_009231 [Henosepilachna vigintioctopunctata]|uniref:Uncharacterized protein n=1 Tax=Henosepilachna vigintioctopunctata TaxID=420089 RepID=A0AAW1UYB6_9CUCU